MELVFEDAALKALAKMAYMENETSENIGARRLYTVMEKLLEDISFYASEYDRDVFTVTEICRRDRYAPIRLTDFPFI